MNTQKNLWDEPAETRDPAQQQRLQLQGVRTVLDWVTRHSPFYRERLAMNEERIKSVNTLADYAEAVPLTSKQDLRDAMEQSGNALPHLCVPTVDIVLAGPSAGTSGRRTFQAYTAQDLDHNVQIAARLLWCCGLRSTDTFHLLTTPSMPGATIFRLAAQRIGVKWVLSDDHDPLHIPRYVDVAQSLKPTFLFAGLPTLRAMLRHVKASGAGKPLGYTRAILGGAALGAEAREEFKKELGVDVFTLSGQGSDFNLFSTHCEHHHGEHWHGDDLTLVELIDPGTGRPAKDGELGELVLTDFYRRATPHLRWRTEDLYRMHTGACACGRTTRRLTLLDRLANRVPVEGGAVYPYQVEESLSRSAEGRNLEFSLVRRDQPVRTLEVRLLRPASLPADQAHDAALRIAAHLRAELAVEVNAEFHDQLKYLGYKTLRVVDEAGRAS